MDLIYLAGPYSDPDPGVMERRAACHRKAAAALINGSGAAVFSPIAQCHQIAVEFGLPGDFAFWRDFDRRFIEVSDVVYVLELPGWEESVGVTAEIAYANDLGIPVVGLPVAAP